MVSVDFGMLDAPEIALIVHPIRRVRKQQVELSERRHYITAISMVNRHRVVLIVGFHGFKTEDDRRPGLLERSAVLTPAVGLERF